MSRSRPHKKRGYQLQRPQPVGSTATATAERAVHPPILIPLPDEISPIREANTRRRKGNGMRSISQAWDDTEALGITADMRRSGPGMLSDQDRKDTLYKAYLNSVWISACVDVISKRITSGGYTIEYTGKNEMPTPEEEKQKEALQQLLEFTNDDEDFLQLIRAIVTDILIYGESYLEVVKRNGVPYSLHKVDCITMNYKLDRHGNITKFIQNMYHSTATIDFDPDEVIRFWLPSPNASKIALSPIERIMGSIDADVHMADWVRSFFRKGARPNFWIKFPGPREEADRFVTWLRENYTGMANAHVPLVLFDEAELYEIGKGSVDIDFLKGRELMCKEILAAYQVPPALVGLIESGNIGGGTGESQEKSFLRNACDPIRAIVFGSFNWRVVKQAFGISCWKISTHYADYRDDQVVGEIADKRIRNGSLNINEVRRDMNRQPVDGGDINVIVTTREVSPLDRLPALSDEQAAQADIALKQAQAQVELTQAQVEKTKQPPPQPVHVVAPAQASQAGQNQPPADSKQNPKERELQADISRLIETLNAHTREVDAQDRAERLLTDLLTRYRQLPPALEEDHVPLVSRVNEALDGVEELRRMIQARDVTPPAKRTRRKKAIPLIESTQGHTGMMLAFMLDPDTARQLALPDGEPVGDLHCTLAFMGNAEDFTGDIERLKEVVSKFAASSTILRGKTSGIRRFTPSDSSDGKTPLYASVDVPGLAEFRSELVERLEEAGFSIDKTHKNYVPHITLAYLPTQEEV